MLILILIDVQYLPKVVFNFEKGSNGQKHSSSDSHHPIRKFPPAKFPIPLQLGEIPQPLILFEKPCSSQKQSS